MNPRISLPSHLSHRPFTAAEAAAAGIRQNRLRGPDIERLHRGIYVTKRPLTLLDRCAGLQLKMASYAFFCGPTAALLYGVPLPWRLSQATDIHVGVPAGRRALVGQTIRGHTLKVSAGDVRSWQGLQISRAPHLWCQLGATISLPDLVAAGDFLIQTRAPLATRADLAETASKFRGRRGSLLLVDALPLLDDMAESPQESRLRVLIVRAGFNGLVAQLEITTSGGYRYRADLAFPAVKLIIEYQSAFHETPESFRKDMTRVSRLSADEWTVMQINKDDMRDETELLARIRTMYAICERNVAR